MIKGCTSSLDGTNESKNQFCQPLNISQHLDHDKFRKTQKKIFDLSEIKNAFQLKNRIANVSNVVENSDICVCQTHICNGVSLTRFPYLLPIALLSFLFIIEH
jgi:hypothetical protein